MDESPNLPSAILEEARKMARARLVTVLQNGGAELIKDDAYFCDLVKTVLQLIDGPDISFAEKVGTTGATLNRWKNEGAHPSLPARKSFVTESIKHLTELDLPQE